MRDQAQSFFEKLQVTIVARLEAMEHSARFDTTLWDRAGGGGGRTRLIENGVVYEKGGVSTSAVWGDDFFATGISLVLHPKNPFIPTVHMNLRYMEKQGKRWFGGGVDLTPYYLFEKDVHHFHQHLKHACDLADPLYYTHFKKQCDEYFYLKHREEHRGVGGIFFDKLDDLEKDFNFVQSVGKQFVKGYLPIVNARVGMQYTQRERLWQEIRRGRYVEFNLLFDEGTKFGLETKGRIDSILMSLPPVAKWPASLNYEISDTEKTLLNVLKQPRSWV